MTRSPRPSARTIASRSSDDAGATLPIADYAAIGNLASIAMVGRNGSIDWCCFPALDRPSTFGALLDGQRGGRFRVWAEHATTSAHRYRDGTNVLETRHSTSTAELEVVDFMPVFGDLRVSGVAAIDQIHRLLLAHRGDVDVYVDWSPRFDYARLPTGVGAFDRGYPAARGI